MISLLSLFGLLGLLRRGSLGVSLLSLLSLLGVSLLGFSRFRCLRNGPALTGRSVRIRHRDRLSIGLARRLLVVFDMLTGRGRVGMGQIGLLRTGRGVQGHDGFGIGTSHRGDVARRRHRLRRLGPRPATA